ncbi:hypothetical protein T11_14795 [Trichinella zimbabwensis]|uniref:Uncharacterized protein n=1 Tax=Trichinella zimbabwensis TaxID=268475 RepID=A0A0V1GUI7_9BILA|nr:hypothetical protein T11_14795 [Trichinella zimbabwensis]
MRTVSNIMFKGKTLQVNINVAYTLIEVQLALVLLIGIFLPCLTKNDPTLKIVPLYYPPMTCPLMNNHDFLSIAYIDILQNMLDRKIILSNKNLIELIAIVLHERCQKLNTQVLENIPLPIWVGEKTQVEQEK